VSDKIAKSPGPASRRRFLKNSALAGGFGRIIADLEAGREEVWKHYPFVNANLYYVPNEPFRWLAAESGLAWYGLTGGS
jgi:hypothetical protein